jgi:hypothetical protein
MKKAIGIAMFAAVLTLGGLGLVASQTTTAESAGCGCGCVQCVGCDVCPDC